KRLIQQVNTLLTQGKPDEALALIESTPPTEDAAFVRRALSAQCLMMLKRYVDAYPLLALTEAEGGGNVDLWLARAEAESQLNMPTLAERNLRRVVQLQPKHFSAESAREYINHSRESREALAESLGVDPDTLQEAMALEEATYLPLLSGEYQAIEDSMRSAIEICPAYEPLYLTLVQSLLLQDKVDAAIAEQRELSTHPTVAGAQAT